MSPEFINKDKLKFIIFQKDHFRKLKALLKLLLQPSFLVFFGLSGFVGLSGLTRLIFSLLFEVFKTWPYYSRGGQRAYS